MATLVTERFGTREVCESEILHFPRGIIGFEQHRRFVLLPHREGSPFQFLQSWDDPKLAFVVIDPRAVVPDYTVRLPRESLASIGLGGGEEPDAVVLGIVTLPSDPSLATVNLKAPVLINARNRQAAQLILEEPRYAIRHPLFASRVPEAVKERERQAEREGRQVRGAAVAEAG